MVLYHDSYNETRIVGHTLTFTVHVNDYLKPSPGSSVLSDACYQSRSCEYDPQLGQNSFGRLTKYNATRISLIPLIGLQSFSGRAAYWLEISVVWSTGVRKSENTGVGELAAVI